MVEIKKEMNGVITFIKELERLKETTRTARTINGNKESVADHSWRLALFAAVLEDYFPELNFTKVLEMCLIHDIGEAYEGDISAVLLVNEKNQADKLIAEEKAMLRITQPLKETTKNKLLSLWQEYNNGETQESKLVKALDKMETIIQHNQGDNPEGFDYDFNLNYGKSYAAANPITMVLRELIDDETRQKIDSDK